MHADWKESYAAALRELFRRDAGVIARILLSIGAGLVAAALAMFGTWFYARLRLPTGGRLYVRDDDLLVAFIGALMVWVGGLTWIWRGTTASRQVLVPFTLSAAVGLVTVLAGVAIERAFTGDEEVLIGGVCLLGAAIVVVIWAPVLMRLTRGRGRVVSDENLVQVFCPTCGYSLIGLSEARCPECGAQFTIDELIRRQGYDGAARKLHGSRSVRISREGAEDAGLPAAHQ